MVEISLTAPTEIFFSAPIQQCLVKKTLFSGVLIKFMRGEGFAEPCDVEGVSSGGDVEGVSSDSLEDHTVCIAPVVPRDRRTQTSTQNKTSYLQWTPS